MQKRNNLILNQNPLLYPVMQLAIFSCMYQWQTMV